MKPLLFRRRKPKSDHFDGRRFTNQEPGFRRYRDLLRWFWNRQSEKWPIWVDSTPGEAPVKRVAKGEMRITFIHHASFLIQVDGVNILTDPIWSKRCSPFSWFGPRRVRPPGIRWADLPPIDLLLVTHNHYDHMDFPTLRRLSTEHAPVSLTAKGNARLLKKAGLKHATELDWWQGVDTPQGLQVTLVPARHASGRSFWDQNKTLWGGFILKTSMGSIYFAGDTAYGKHFRQIRAICGSPSIAFLPIGCYRPHDFMSPVHMSPYDAVEAHIELGAEKSFGMHFGTFHLSDEAIDDPVKELSKALEIYNLPSEQFVALAEGSCWNSCPK